MESVHAAHLYESSEPLALVASPLAGPPNGSFDDWFDIEAFLSAVSAMHERRNAVSIVSPLHAASMHFFSFSGLAFPAGQRAATALGVLTRYGLPCSRLMWPDSWAVAVGPYALHLDAYTACRIARPTAGTFAVAGRPYPVAEHDLPIDLQGWAIRVALHLEGAGDPVDPNEYGTTLKHEPDEITALEARLAEARGNGAERPEAST